MKKILKALLGGLCAFALAACGMPKAAAEMDVVIVEKTGQSFLAVIDGKGAGTAMYLGSGYPVYDENGEEVSADVLQPGMIVEVGFDGSMLSTFPAQVSGCKYLKLTGEQTDVTDLAAELEEYLPKAEPADPMPTLQVECEGKQVASCLNAPRGSSSWVEGDEAVMMDSPHPLQWAEQKLAAVSIPDGAKKLRLILSEEPEELTVRRWKLDDIGDSAAEAETVTPDKEQKLPVREGVYEVEAKYPEGTLTWAFMVE